VLVKQTRDEPGILMSYLYELFTIHYSLLAWKPELFTIHSRLGIMNCSLFTVRVCIQVWMIHHSLFKSEYKWMFKAACMVQGACMCIWEVAHQASMQFPVHIQPWMNVLAISPFPLNFKVCIKMPLKSGNWWEINKHLCSWVVESTAYE
jgi:hypothetical protein